MKIEKSEADFTVFKLSESACLQSIIQRGDFCFIGITDNEISVVCETKNVPDCVTIREDGWKGFRVVGKLDFTLIGILSSITAALADQNISVFAVSTFDTDYFFVKKQSFSAALSALVEAGFSIIN